MGLEKIIFEKGDFFTKKKQGDRFAIKQCHTYSCG
jgi:hypothetical protein